MITLTKKLPLLLFVFLSLFLNSCNIENLKMTGVKGFAIKSFEKNKLTFNMSVGIENPNRLRFKMINNDMDLTVNKIALGKAKITNKIVIPAKSHDVYNFDVEVNLSQLALGTIPSLIEMFRSKGVEVQIEGFVKGRTMLISKTVPIKITERVDFSKMK
jgi:LEA14-like dessication related protein